MPSGRASRTGGPACRVLALATSALLATCVVALVGIDDGADQSVPDHVVRGQLGEVDVLDVPEDVAHDLEAGAGAAGEVDLGDVAGDDHLGAEAEAGEEHLHLLARGV